MTASVWTSRLDGCARKVERGTEIVLLCRVGRIPERRRGLPDDMRRRMREELERVWNELPQRQRDVSGTVTPKRVEAGGEPKETAP